MPGGASLILAALGGALIVPAGHVPLADRAVRLGDVIQVATLERTARAALSRRVIAVLPDDVRSITLSRAALAALVRRSVPGIALTGDRGGSVELGLAPGVKTGDRRRMDCRALIAPVARDARITRDNVRPAICGDSKTAAIRFDRVERRLSATRDLAAGTELGRTSVPAAPLVAKGDVLTLVSTQGPVQVRRVVTALQPATARRLFVRDADGQVFAARLAPDEAVR